MKSVNFKLLKVVSTPEQIRLPNERCWVDLDSGTIWCQQFH